MVRTNQGGSILSFVVLGGVMAILLIGGAYMVRHTFVPTERKPQVATSGEGGESSKQTQGNGQATPAPNNKQSGETNNSGSEAAPNSANNSANSSTPSTEKPESAPASDGQASNGLPTTGPSGTLFAGIMLSSLVALLMAYMQSRRFGVSL
jgi:hypothetical protein